MTTTENTTSTEKAVLKGKVVTILNEVGSLAKVLPEGGEDFEAYWVKAAELKPYVSPEVIAALKNGLNVPVFAYKPTGSETYTDFAPWFSSEDYTLVVQVRSDSHDVAAAEYAAWAGECIPEEHIREYAEHFTDSEWILTFPFNENAAYPFSIVMSGTGGGKALGEAAGILTGNVVRVNFKSIIEPLVRAGLRTRL